MSPYLASALVICNVFVLPVVAFALITLSVWIANKTYGAKGSVNHQSMGNQQ
jgi:hypothetical protein